MAIVFGAPIFVILWLLGVINVIRVGITKRKLSKRLDKIFPKNRNHLFGGSFQNSYKTKYGLKIFTSFGSPENVKNYIDTFINIKAIEASEEEKTILLLNRFIKRTSNGIRIWLSAFLIILLTFIMNLILK